MNLIKVKLVSIKHDVNVNWRFSVMLMEEFYDAYYFIEDHPAFMGVISKGVSSLDLIVTKCCKRGLSNLDIIYVYRSDDRFDEFLGKGYKESLGYETSDNDHIWVQYKDYYGEKWSFHHVEFWIEGGCHYYDILNDETRWRWQSFYDCDLNSKGNSYEEAIIDFAKKVKKKYGDYSCIEYHKNTIIPSWIVENNKINKPFGEDMSNIFKDGKFNRNPKNIPMKTEEINALWWHFYKPNEKFGNSKIPDITKFLSKENY